jgi:hypothetical protein
MMKLLFFGRNSAAKSGERIEAFALFNRAQWRSDQRPLLL